MVQSSIFVIKAKQQRAHQSTLAGPPEASHHAVYSANQFDLLHRGAFAARIWHVQPLRNHTIKSDRSQLLHPSFCRMNILRLRLEPYWRLFWHPLKELLQSRPTEI